MAQTRRPSAGDVLALAPDDASRRAAAGLAVDAPGGPWADAGTDGRAVWGTCRGTARQPYSVACDTAAFAYRCTCPSAKQPCKHVLALLMLWAAGSAAVAAIPAPPEVAAWVAGRPAGGDGAVPPLAEAIGERAGGGADTTVPATPAPGPYQAGPADPGAAAARAEARAERMRAGMAELDLWLGDLLRHGLGWAASQPYRFWDAMAARLVDASAPGAAGRVRDLPSLLYSGEGWPARMLGALSRLHLLAAGWARYGQLPAALQADLRTAAGWAWPTASVLAEGARERDRWYVLARVAIDDPQLRVQRTWLWGLGHGRPALLVDFARPGTPFAWQLWPGAVVDAEVARYPGSAPLRVLVAGRPDGDTDDTGGGADGGTGAYGEAPPGWTSLAEMAAARGRCFAADPWLERWPVSVGPVVPGLGPAGWSVTDAAGARLALRVADEGPAWRLLALSGGHPVHLLGEWEGDAIAPLGAWAEGRMVVL